MRAKKEINIQIGDQIKSAREKARLTQEQLAERIDVSPQYVSDLERGVVGASLSTLKHICVSLGVSADQLIFGRQSESSAAAVSLLFQDLTQEQQAILAEIIAKFVEAIHTERNHKPHQS